MKENVWIGRNEAAILLGCTMQTISNYIKSGLVVTKTVNKKVMIDRRTLMMMAPDLTEIYNLGKKVEETKQQLANELKNLQREEVELRQTAGLIGHSIVNKVNTKFIITMLGCDDFVQREKDVVRLLVEGLSLDEIANRFDLTRERTRQIAEKACRKMFVGITRFRKLTEKNGSLKELNDNLRNENEQLSNAIRLNKSEIEEKSTEANKEEQLLFGTRLINFDLSVRALNCLKAAEIDTFGQLIQMRKVDLLRFRNFGKRTLAELDELVISKGYHFAE